MSMSVEEMVELGLDGDPRAALVEIAEEVVRLRQWQDEAIAVMVGWETCWQLLDVAGLGGRLGRAKSVIVYEYLEESLRGQR